MKNSYSRLCVNKFAAFDSILIKHSYFWYRRSTNKTRRIKIRHHRLSKKQSKKHSDSSNQDQISMKHIHLKKINKIEIYNISFHVEFVAMFCLAYICIYMYVWPEACKFTLHSSTRNSSCHDGEMGPEEKHETWKE